MGHNTCGISSFGPRTYSVLNLCPWLARMLLRQTVFMSFQFRTPPLRSCLQLYCQPCPWFTARNDLNEWKRLGTITVPTCSQRRSATDHHCHLVPAALQTEGFCGPSLSVDSRMGQILNGLHVDLKTLHFACFPLVAGEHFEEQSEFATCLSSLHVHTREHIVWDAAKDVFEALCHISSAHLAALSSAKYFTLKPIPGKSNKMIFYAFSVLLVWKCQPF